MELIFLGTGSAFYPILGNTSAYIKRDDDLLLLDCGESVYQILYHGGLLEMAKNVYVLITHLHTDHVGSLGSLLSYMYYVKHRKVTIIHPCTAIVDLLTMQGVRREVYIYSPVLPENALHINASAVEVTHVDDMKCYGYILRDGADSLYYSGDSAHVSDVVKDMFCKGEIDRIYHDTATYESLHPTHCYYGELERDFPAECRDRIFCMHLDSSCERLLSDKGFQIATTAVRHGSAQTAAGCVHKMRVLCEEARE